MKKFLVLYLTPIKVVEDWAKTDPAERKAAEDRMNSEWKKWMNDNSKAIKDAPAGAGKTKVVKSDGVSDTKNNIMMYSIIEAASHDEAAALFTDHPHLQIPQSSIEIMEINPIQ